MNQADDLIQSHLEGEASVEQSKQLADWITSSESNADAFVREAFIHHKIGETVRGQAGWQASARHRHSRTRRWAILSVAAGVLIAVVAGSMLLRGDADAVRVLSSVDARWRDSNGSELAAGSHELVSGLARLKFKSGADVVVQGPAVFQTSADAMSLASGSAAVTCSTPASRSFVLSTPTAKVVDLGTEYGVRVDVAQKASSVRVYDGAVRVDADGQDSTRVDAGGAVRVTGEAVVRVGGNGAGQGSFVRAGEVESQQLARQSGWTAAMHAARRDSSLLFWCDMNASGGPGRLYNLARGDAPVIKLAASASGRTTAGPRERDSAVAIRSTADAIPISIDGSFSALTFAAWVRLDAPPPANPVTGEPARRGLLLSDGWLRTGQVHWQVKGNGFRLSYFNRGDDEDVRYSVDAPQLFDGSWHFIATTIVTTGRQVTVTHYVDGLRVFVRTMDESLQRLVLGDSKIGGWNPSPGDTETRPLAGDIDEFAVWSRALSMNEVKTLFDAQAASPTGAPVK